jgi:hypothetical protein
VYVVEEPGMPLILRLWARSGERRQPLGSILVRCGVELDGDEATLARAADRHQERVEHEQIQRGVIGAQRTAVIELRDRREINDRTLRAIERDLDLEELRMEG